MPVSIMQGRIYIDRGDYQKAVDVLKRVFDQDKEMVSETLPMLEICYTKLEQPAEWAEYLLTCSDENIGATAELYLADIIEKQEGPEMAITYVNRQLQRHPTMRLFCRLMEYYLSEAEEGRAKESLGQLRNMVGEQIRTKPDYRCGKCGFTSHALYWHCPSCRSWDTIKPIRGLDGQ